MKSLKLIVGLGNPGKQYAATRHNAGAWWLQSFCAQHYVQLKNESKFQAGLAQASINNTPLRCLLPTTFMNESGISVSKVANYFSIKAEEILVVHDELDLPPGQVRFKFAGGHAGHNGLRDIMGHLGTGNFHRLRLGIGHPGNKAQVTNFVLGTPSISERKQIDAAIDCALAATPLAISGDWEQAIQQLSNAVKSLS